MGREDGVGIENKGEAELAWTRKKNKTDRMRGRKPMIMQILIDQRRSHYYYGL